MADVDDLYSTPTRGVGPASDSAPTPAVAAPPTQTSDDDIYATPTRGAGPPISPSPRDLGPVPWSDVGAGLAAGYHEGMSDIGGFGSRFAGSPEMQRYYADQALRATDLLIQSGGFGLVAVDLSDIAPKIVRYVPLNAWFRFRRAVEDTPTILMVMEQEANAKTCASLVLRLKAQPAEWTEVVAGRESVRDFQDFMKYPFARLLKGFEIAADVVRSRVQCANDFLVANKNEFSSKRTPDRAGIFEAVAS